MNEITREEIERAIETIEGYIKAVEQRMRAGDVGVVVGYDAMLERRKGLVTALDICRAELTRQENAPLTCDGRGNLPTKYGSGVYVNAPCRICVRGITTHDFYKKSDEPKGEPICTQD